jgi:hypothetical protein
MTAAADEHVLATELEELRDNRSLGRKFVDLCKHMPLGVFGAVVVLLMIFAAMFAPYISPYDPELNDFEAQLLSPRWEYLLGTDPFGRDQFTRIIYGARTALFVGFSCSFIGATIGLVLGVMSAYFGGTFDLLFQRVMDVFLAFPLIILALAVVATFGTKGIFFGTTYENVIIAITIPFIPRCARVVRSNALSIREIPYVDAARALGFLSRPRRAGADPGLGPDAARRCRGIRGKCALGPDLPGARHHRRGVRVQPVRRCGPRHPGPETTATVIFDFTGKAAVSRRMQRSFL